MEDITKVSDIKKIKVNIPSLNIRFLPDDKSTIVGVAKLGEILSVLGEREKWYKVIFNGKICWVFKQYVTPIRPEKRIPVSIIDMLITNKINRPYRKNNPKYLAVHWTANEGNGADADANARYFQNTTRSASAHYIVDDKQIVRCIPEDEVAYSVGANKYTEFKEKNIGSNNPNNYVISIEMCVNSDGDFWKMYSNTAHLCADILERHNWDIDRLIRHFDVTEKKCPVFFVDDYYARKYTDKNAKEAWECFKNDVKKLL